MREKKPAPTREQRLAAKLRENLHRRKAQARGGSDAAARATSLPKDDSSG
ncbi:hypothetical protein [Novosphingobium sp.]|nr:hypothetical protein [Novosphingobium sp.]